MQSSVVKRQIAMLDMDTSSFLLSLLSAPSWNCLENNKKKWSQSQSKNFMSPNLSRMNFNLIFCCPKYHPETYQESSAQYQQADQAPWFNTLANNNHNNNSSNRSLKEYNPICSLFKLSPQWNLLSFSSKLTPVERSWVQSSSKAAHPHLSSRRQQSHFTTEVNRSWLMSFV